ncbi:MAG: ribokinase [Promethearchaeota archaeon]
MMLEETDYVLIIGSSNMDLNIYSKRFPNPGETVTGGTFKQFLGGKGANQSVASVRSGVKTVFIGKIGIDIFGDQMISQLTKEGINMNHVIRDPEEMSGVAFILIDENGENMISVAPGANIKLSPQDIRSKTSIIENAKCIVVQMEIPMDTIKEILNISTELDNIKILNPAPLKPLPKQLLEKVDIIIPNKGELFKMHSLLGFEDLDVEENENILQVSKDIASLGIKYVITTLGARGCFIYSRGENKAIEVAAPNVKAVDTVGAGDCFIGVLASRLCKGEKVLNAVKYASVAASIAVTRKGAQVSMPFSNEVEAKLKELAIEIE